MHESRKKPKSAQKRQGGNKEEDGQERLYDPHNFVENHATVTSWDYTIGELERALEDALVEYEDNKLQADFETSEIRREFHAAQAAWNELTAPLIADNEAVLSLSFGQGGTGGAGASVQKSVASAMNGQSMREECLVGVRAMGIKQAYEVGGCIRDELLGRDPKDIDIAVCGLEPEELLALCKQYGHAEPLLVADKLVGVRLWSSWAPGDGVEFALARTEVSTGDGRHDFAIRPGAEVSIYEDLARRDFTCNAIARNIYTGEMIDPYNGADDIRKGVLRTVSPDSFRDDSLRILRGIARIAKDDLRPDTETLQQMRAWAPNLKTQEQASGTTVQESYALPLSGERIYEEMNKALGGDHVADAFRIARDAGVMAEIVPEFRDTIGFNQESKYHDLACDEHILLVLQRACEFNAPQSVRWAALMHDTGKPASAWRGKDGRLHYYYNKKVKDCPPSHEVIGAARVDSAFDRFHADNKTRKKVRTLVFHHMYRDDDNAHALLAHEHKDEKRASKDRAKLELKARRFIFRVGRDNVEELMLLRRCDRGGKHPGAISDVNWDEDLNAFESVVREQIKAPLSLGELAIDGNDLILKDFKGEAIGASLKALMKRVVDNPHNNTREQLMKWAAEMPREYDRKQDAARATARKKPVTPTHTVDGNPIVDTRGDLDDAPPEAVLDDA